jgi:hypothetical protein
MSSPAPASAVSPRQRLVSFRGILPFGKPWLLFSAAKRTLESHADLRWGADRKGFRRLLHPNGICLFGLWEIAEDTPYSGYFRKGSRGLVITRYSTCCTETRRGNTRSLAMVGRIYPTTDPNHADRLPTASFITQEDIGGDDTRTINDAVLRNAPNTTGHRRGLGVGILAVTGLVLNIAEKKPSIRQVYQIAELGKPAGVPTRAPIPNTSVAVCQPTKATVSRSFVQVTTSSGAKARSAWSRRARRRSRSGGRVRPGLVTTTTYECTLPTALRPKARAVDRTSGRGATNRGP